MSDKAKDIYSGIKKILRSPSLSGSSGAGRRSSSGSFSLSGALSSFSLTRSVSTSSADASTINKQSKYDDAELAAAAAAAADELTDGHKKKERRPSFSFATWKDKHRAKKQAQQAQKEAEKVAVAYGATAATPRAVNHSSASSSSAADRHRSISSSSASSSSATTPRTRTQSNMSSSSNSYTDNNHRGGGTTNSSSSSSSSAPPVRTRSNTSTTAPPSAARIARDNSVRSRAASSATLARGSSSSSSTNPNAYSFTAHRQEKKTTAEQASTMVVDDLTTIVKPRRRDRTRPHSAHWNNSSDSDSDESADTFEAPRTRGLSRRSISMDFMEPQQASHLISKIWRKLPIQARLYGRGSVDLDLEKDRTSISRSSATKQLHRGDSYSSNEYAMPPSSPLPDENNVFGDKHIRFHPKISFSPATGIYTAIESYDDALVRVCQFAAHDQRRTAIKVQEFLERSICYLRGTTTKRGQKVSIANEEIKMWRRLARHDWKTEEITVLPGSPPPPAPLMGKEIKRASPSCSSVTEEEETDEDEPIVAPAHETLMAVCQVVNYCLNTGDSLFTARDVEDLVTLELLVEEDGWI